MKAKRSLRVIAQEIKEDWTNVHFSAKPYLDAMQNMNTIDSNFHMDSGHLIVAYFLANARTWKGEVARRIKKELNKLTR